MTQRFSWRFPESHPSLPGHFPGQPIAPGVVLLDRLVLFLHESSGQGTPAPVVRQAKFLQAVAPGDELGFVLEERGDGSFAFRIERGDALLVHGVVARAGALAS